MINLHEHTGGIVEIRFDAEGDGVNVLGEESMNELDTILGDLNQRCTNGTCKGIVFTSAKKGIFLAGADVKAFVGVAEKGDAAFAASKAAEGQEIFSKISRLPVPTVAAVNGVCLGGGLELALACTSRIASDGPEVKMGLPEVRLGLVPGWGGTQRLPRLVGASRALDLILTGRSLSGRKAKSIGLVDAVVPVEGIDYAGRLEAARLAAGGRPRRPKWSLLDRFGPGRALVFRTALKKVLSQTKGHYPAPPAAIEAVRFGLSHSIKEGLSHEAKQLGQLLIGDTSKNLVRIFLTSRAAASGGERKTTTDKPSPSGIGVIGAGTMGGGIAAVAAMSGLRVRLKDVDARALSVGMKQVQKMARDAIRKKRLPRHIGEQREALVAPTIDESGFSRCDLVVEAVVEDMGVKHQVLHSMEAVLSPQAVFATNTSSLSVAEIAAPAKHPERVLGLHFFNPVPKMPLVEIVRGPATSDEAVGVAMAVAKKMGKTPVVVKDTPGFIVNRILMPYLAGAMTILADPEKVTTVDRELVGFGMPMGPFALLDQIGLDVAAKVAGVLEKAFPRGNGNGNGKSHDRLGPRLLEAMVQAGSLGIKAGKGFYTYKGKGKAAGVSPELGRLLSAVRGTGPATNGSASHGSVVDILIDDMVNEAAMLLGEGAVDKPETIDLAMVFGTGFPPFRGGLLRHADTVGPGTIARRLEARGVAPAPLLTSRERFYE